RDRNVTGVQTCALPIWKPKDARHGAGGRRADRSPRPRRPRAGARAPAGKRLEFGPQSEVREWVKKSILTASGSGSTAPGSRAGKIGRASCRERGEDRVG